MRCSFHSKNNKEIAMKDLNYMSIAEDDLKKIRKGAF